MRLERTQIEMCFFLSITFVLLMLIIHTLKAYFIYFIGVIPSAKILVTYATLAIFTKFVIKVFETNGIPEEYFYMNRKIVAEIEG